MVGSIIQAIIEPIVSMIGIIIESIIGGIMGIFGPTSRR